MYELLTCNCIKKMHLHGKKVSMQLHVNNSYHVLSGLGRLLYKFYTTLDPT